MKIVCHNIEGFSANKAQILANLNADFLCLQETHRTDIPPTVPGMHLAVNIPSRTYGSAILVKDKALITNTEIIEAGEIELLRVETKHLNIISLYKPPNVPFTLPPNLISGDKTCVVVGDFNSHSVEWGYEEDDQNGEAVISWALNNNLDLLYDAKDPPTFNSRRWRRGYNPDLIFVTSSKSHLFRRTIKSQVPKSQHRPIEVVTQPVVSPITSNKLQRFNFRKADWTSFAAEMDQGIKHLPPVPQKYDDFVKLIWKAGQQNIPRGCRPNYIPGLNEASSQVYEEYTRSYEEDPYSQRTIDLGETLLDHLSDERRVRWKEMLESMDMRHNSKRAWTTINKLTKGDNPPQRIAAVTPNQVANQLVRNGKPAHKEKLQVKKQKKEQQEILLGSNDLIEPFTLEDLKREIKNLKLGKAAGIDGIPNEFLKHLGPEALSWLVTFYNNCLSTRTIPKKWKQARVVALLKPGKEVTNPKSYRPISLLCTTYKLYERLIMTRISPAIEEQLTPDQAGFRPGRSCCGQVLNLTQFIEDGYETRHITGAVFVDLSAAYDTINHRSLLLKIARMTRNRHTVDIIASLLQNRRFYVETDGKRSRWQKQKNGLPQGSVLAPLLFNIYTNDQPSCPDTRRFIYADDLCIATQAKSFGVIESTLTNALQIMGSYYESCSLNANPAKTQVCAFHLNNREAHRKLKVTWYNKELEYHTNPVYLGVTLDRTLSFKAHIDKLRGKIKTRNNLVKKLVNTKWGADPHTLRSTVLALSFSAAEYCAPVWCRSAHAKRIDPLLNEACRVVTGTLQPTPINIVHRLAGITPPPIRREVTARQEKQKQLLDTRHPLHHHAPVPLRLKSRKSFVTVEALPQDESPQSCRLRLWGETAQPFHPSTAVQPPAETLPTGNTWKRREWCALNRARSRVGRTGDNMVRWGLSESAVCGCGAEHQTMSHILTDCPLSPQTTEEDLLTANDAAAQLIEVWRDKL